MNEQKYIIVDRTGPLLRAYFMDCSGGRVVLTRDRNNAAVYTKSMIQDNQRIRRWLRAKQIRLIPVRSE